MVIFWTIMVVFKGEYLKYYSQKQSLFIYSLTQQIFIEHLHSYCSGCINEKCAILMELRVYWRRQTKTNLINKYRVCRHMCYEKN